VYLSSNAKRDHLLGYPIYLHRDDDEDDEEVEANNDEYKVSDGEKEEEEYGHYSSHEKVRVEASITNNFSSRDSDSELDSDPELEGKAKPKPKEGAHDDEAGPKPKEGAQDGYGFMIFHWNIGTPLTKLLLFPLHNFLSHTQRETATTCMRER